METAFFVVACVSLAVAVLALRRSAFGAAAHDIHGLGRALDTRLREEFRTNRQESLHSVDRLGESLGRAQAQQLHTSTRATTEAIAQVSRLSLDRIDAFGTALTDRVAGLEVRTGEELSATRRDSSTAAERLHDRVTGALAAAVRTQQSTLSEAAALQEQRWGAFGAQVDALRLTIETRVETLRGSVEEQLRAIQADNAARLDQMRQTVDERLQTTLESRLGESFRRVNEQLEQVYKGLGEMQVLATGVGDLKRVLANVKTRGTWGEVQLAMLLEQVLAPDQYAVNVATSDVGGERVEFAIRFPGRSADDDRPTWLPIDSKFPLEDYQSLLEAADRSSAAGIEEAGRRLEARVRQCAREISSKYVNPPRTTDFAIMFLPNEGLYAEVLRRPGLAECLQLDHRIVIAGPTTLWGLLTSFQMGFRTLAIERRSSEVWALLGAVKKEFGKFGAVLDGIQKNLHRAAVKIDQARTGTRAIERKLSEVQELPAADTAALLDGVLIDAVEDDELTRA
jgi:DNA recombination protein RmuC